MDHRGFRFVGQADDIGLRRTPEAVVFTPDPREASTLPAAKRMLRPGSVIGGG